MFKKVTLRKAGGSVSTVLPKDMADRFMLDVGDTVIAVETEDGILISPYDPTTLTALEIARRASKSYRNALRELGK